MLNEHGEIKWYRFKGCRLVLGKHLLLQLLGHLEAALALIAVTGVMLMVTDGKGQVPLNPLTP